LPAEQIAARLDDRFRLLTGGSRTALPRQQTLRALIDWSYDLLSEPERSALAQLSVFAGGWTLEAAEAVVGTDALDLLSHLVDRSLVVVEEGAGEARFRLLETIRQYAREKLFESHKAEQARNRHLDFYLARVEIAEPKLLGPEMIPYLDQLEVEQDNLRAALEWAVESDPLKALRLVAVLFAFWGRRTSITEGYNWVKAALAYSEAAPQVEGKAAQSYLVAKAKALGGEVALAFGLGNNLAARAAVETSISLARQINASQTLAFVLGLAQRLAE
jgi:predicted ATPase